MNLTIRRSLESTVDIVNQTEFNLQNGKTFYYYFNLPQKEGNWSVLISSSSRILTERHLDFSQVWLPAISLKINEISPRAQPEEPEWFEFYNVSSSPVNINGWRFGNNEDTAVITQNNVIVNQGDYFVVTKDADLFKRNHSGINNIVKPDTWHTLDNYNDTLYIWSCNKNLVDKACYSSSWFPGWVNQSIERIDVSTDGCERKTWEISQMPSPGRPNTVLFSRSGQNPSMEIGPVPFTPNKDGKDDQLLINLTLPAAYSAQISIYGFDGRKVRTFSAPPVQKNYWDGNSDNGRPVPTGPFFVVAEFKSGDKKSVIRKKGLLWR